MINGIDLQQLITRHMLKLVFNDNLDKHSTWHFMPAAFIHQTEPIQNAQIKNYFTPSIKQHPQITATFQGNTICGNKSNQSHLFKSIAYRSQNTIQNIQIAINQRVNECTEWRKDKPWKQTEGQIGTINKYLLIQTALHDE